MNNSLATAIAAIVNEKYEGQAKAEAIGMPDSNEYWVVRVTNLRWAHTDIFDSLLSVYNVYPCRELVALDAAVKLSHLRASLGY